MCSRHFGNNNFCFRQNYFPTLSEFWRHLTRCPQRSRPKTTYTRTANSLVARARRKRDALFSGRMKRRKEFLQLFSPRPRSSLQNRPSTASALPFMDAARRRSHDNTKRLLKIFVMCTHPPDFSKTRIRQERTSVAHRLPNKKSPAPLQERGFLLSVQRLRHGDLHEVLGAGEVGHFQHHAAACIKAARLCGASAYAAEDDE
jgi:hypothetical protein